MNYIKDINLKNDNKYKMIVEILEGSKDKNELCLDSFDKLEKVRKIKFKYPFYYGCFPQTHAQDGDALDAVLLTNKKHKLLDVIDVDIIGIIKNIDDGEQDDKVLVKCSDEKLKNIDKLKVNALNFLKIYKGKDSNTVLDEHIYDEEEAKKELDRCHKVYLNRNKKADIDISL